MNLVNLTGRTDGVARGANDGFIMVRSDEELSASRLVVVLNWTQELLERVPVP